MRLHERDQSASLSLSHGWKWNLTRKPGDDGIFRIEQTNGHDRKAPSASIEVHAVDLPWIWIWLRGAYTAEEWPSTRNFPGGTVLFMEPNPKPEVWLVQYPSSDDGLWYGQGRNFREPKPVGRLVLFEEDLRPLVAWLEGLYTRFGIDMRAARTAQMARVGNTRGTGTDDRFYTPRSQTPPTPNPEAAESVAPAPAIPHKESRPEPVREAEEIILRGYTGPGSKEMMMLWPSFVAIHEHYFPRNWITRVRRSLRLVPRLDYSRSNAGMKKFLGDAARTLRTNRGRWARAACGPRAGLARRIEAVGISTIPGRAANDRRVRRGGRSDAGR